MKNIGRCLRIIVLSLICLLPIACSAPQPTRTPDPPTATSVSPTATETPVPPTATATSTPTPLPFLCEGVEGTCVEFRFEKSRCRRVGPEFIPAGEMSLIFSNYNDASFEGGIDLEMLDEGKTWGDMRGRFRDGGSASQPEWSVDVANARLLPGGKSTSVIELTAGTYIAVCWTVETHRIWLAEQLVVEE